MWLYCCGADSPTSKAIPNIVLYDYHNSRRRQCAADFLDGYSRYLQVDGNQGYAKTQAILVACMAHARRKFKDPRSHTGAPAEPKVKQVERTGRSTIFRSHIA